MNSYHFDLGDSNEGPIGFCARVTAATKQDALKVLQDHLPEDLFITISNEPQNNGAFVEYIEVYLNGENITTKDIDDEEELPSSEDSCIICENDNPDGGDGFDGCCPNCADRLNEYLEDHNSVEGNDELTWDEVVALFDGEYIHECQNCGHWWTEDDLNEVKDLSQRVLPGEPMPSGECPKPECQAVCHRKKETNHEFQHRQNL